ncbi:MAG: hypothetical protein GY869_01720, partial [Planctomycetes bacterium]|nr:hypothetical protein [Planctomycetota bacterium]
RPWLFGQIVKYRQTGQSPQEPPLEEKFDVLLWHLAEELKIYGEKRGLLRMRRQMVWYVRGLPGANQLKPELFAASDYQAVTDVLRIYRRNHPELEEDQAAVDDPEPPLSNSGGQW